MASEPERPIEKLLREAAQKRRDQAPASFEPHPATRRLLQSEVASQYPQEGRGASQGSNWLGRILPKLSWAAASLAVVAICLWVLIPRSPHNEQERLFARNESGAAPAQAPVAAPVTEERRPQPLPASDERLRSATLAHGQSSTISAPSEHSIGSRQAAAPPASLALAKEGEPGLRSDSLAMSNPAAGALSLFSSSNAPSLAVAMAEKKAESDATLADLERSFADKSFAATARTGVAQSKDHAPSANVISGFAQNQPMPAAASAPPPVSPPSETAPPASALATSRALQAVTNSVSSLSLAQHFVRNIPKSKTLGAQTAQTPDQHLLVSFQVEQNGPELRVKDEDGSVYLGYLQPAQTTVVLREAGKAVPATAGRTANFQVTDAAAASTGSPPPAAQPYSPQTYFFRVSGTNQTLKLPVLFSGSISNAPGYGLSPTQLSGARISGRVRVGTQREFEVQASPR